MHGIVAMVSNPTAGCLNAYYEIVGEHVLLIGSDIPLMPEVLEGVAISPHDECAWLAGWTKRLRELAVLCEEADENSASDILQAGREVHGFTTVNLCISDLQAAARRLVMATGGCR